MLDKLKLTPQPDGTIRSANGVFMLMRYLGAGEWKCARVDDTPQKAQALLSEAANVSRLVAGRDVAVHYVDVELALATPTTRLNELQRRELYRFDLTVKGQTIAARNPKELTP